MKKFISILLVLSLICCVPTVLAEGGGLDSGETSVTEYCGTCNSYTSCEVCTDYEYTYRNYDEHWVTYYEAVICTSCNSRLSSFPYYETSESHSYDDYGICSGCGATWDR